MQHLLLANRTYWKTLSATRCATNLDDCATTVDARTVLAAHLWSNRHLTCSSRRGGPCPTLNVDLNTSAFLVLLHFTAA